MLNRICVLLGTVAVLGSTVNTGAASSRAPASGWPGLYKPIGRTTQLSPDAMKVLARLVDQDSYGYALRSVAEIDADQLIVVIRELAQYDLVRWKGSLQPTQVTDTLFYVTDLRTARFMLNP